VMLRCLSRVAMLGTLLAIGLGFQPMAAHAASANASTTTYDYSLTTPTTIPIAGANLSGPQDVAIVTPNGSGVAPTLFEGPQGPIFILNDSTGFDLTKPIMLDLVKDTTPPSGQTEQQLGFLFSGQAFQPGDFLHISLTFNGVLTGPPPELQSITGPINFAPDPPTTTSAGTSGNAGSSSGSSTSGIINNPEPLSVILWSAVLVGVVARNRMLSRRMAD